MATVQQFIIDPACKLLGLIAAGRSMATGEYADILDALNELLDSSSAEGLLIFQITHETFPLTGPATYTIGPAATFNTTRPEKIRAAAVLTATNDSQPIDIVSAEKFETIEDRSATGMFADMLTCDYAAPVATIYLWPAPVTGNTLELWSLKPLATFATIGDTIALPVGYQAYLKYNLAIAIAGQFAGSKLTDTIVEMAKTTKADLANLHTQILGESAPLAAPMPVRRVRPIDASGPPPPVTPARGE